MARSDKQVNVSLSGTDVEIFESIKKELYLGNDAEVFRICMRFFQEYYDPLKRHGVYKEDINQIPNILDLIKEGKAILERLRQLETRFNKIEQKCNPEAVFVLDS